MRALPFVVLAIAAALTACASVPASNSALDKAHSRFATVKTNPQVAELAPEETQRAADALRAADLAWTEKEPATTVDHLAYLADQRVTIAQETASSRASRAVTEGAAAERDKVRLALRTREADVAQQQLAVSQKSDAQKTAALAGEQARVADLESELRALNAKKTERGMVVTLGDVLFDSGQSRLSPAGTRNMTTLADFFKRYPQRTATIEGYTDSIGSDSSNLALSERRASSVMTALVSLGVPSDRLSTRAHGSQMPVADNGTAAGRQMNRRVEVVFAPQP